MAEDCGFPALRGGGGNRSSLALVTASADSLALPAPCCIVGSVWHLHTNYVAILLDAERHELAAWICRRFQGDRVLLIYHDLAVARGLASVEALLHGDGVAAETPGEVVLGIHTELTQLAWHTPRENLHDAPDLIRSNFWLRCYRTPSMGCNK